MFQGSSGRKIDESKHHLGKPRWLPKHSAVNVQGLASFDHHKLARRMGQLSSAQMTEVKTAIRDLLGL